MSDEIEYIWVRYRHRFAYGIDKKWQYTEIPCEDYIKKVGYDDIGSWLMEEERVGESHDFSDKYRGIEYDKVDNPPVDEIMSRLNRHRSYVKYHKEMIIKYQKMLDELGHVTKGDFAV